MKLLSSAVIASLALASTAYAVCVTAPNYTPSAVETADHPKFALMCEAQRLGGSGWVFSGSRQIARAGVAYRASEQVCDGSSCYLTVSRVSDGVAVSFHTYPVGPVVGHTIGNILSTFGTCSVWWQVSQSGGAVVAPVWTERTQFCPQ